MTHHPHPSAWQAARAEAERILAGVDLTKSGNRPLVLLLDLPDRYRANFRHRVAEAIGRNLHKRGWEIRLIREERTP